MNRKERLDKLLVEFELADDEKTASALIMSGDVLVDEKPVTTAGSPIDRESRIRLRRPAHPYVSRGGIKLAHALDAFNLNVAQKIALDIGASTGGFTDCLLKRGAHKVYAVDVGYGQLDMSLQRDRRVVILDRTNIRALTPETLAEPLDLVTVDLSFVAAASVISTVDFLLHPLTPSPLPQGGEGETHVIILVKPQFEVDREAVEKGGIVKDPVLHRQAIDRVILTGQHMGWEVIGETPSPITGAKGNHEFFVAFKRR